jgi:hypothetical protein
MFALTTLSAGSSLTLVIGALALNGMGFALFMPSVVKWALLGVRKEQYSLLTGISETARLAGISVSNAVIIVMFSLIMGSAEVGPGTIPGFVSAARASVVVYGVMGLAAVVIVAWGAWRRT